MKLLLTADLHGNRRWYEWLLAQASRYDLVALAGDLFDLYNPSGPIPQILAFGDFCQAMRSRGCALAFCCGNHDAVGEWDADFSLRALRSMKNEGKKRLREILVHQFWPDAFNFEPSEGRHAIVSDGHYQVLTFHSGERLLVSCHPYPFPDPARLLQTWADAAAARQQHRVAWLALHHEPPLFSKVGGPDGSEELADLIRCLPPNYVLGGHLHEQPYRDSGDWKSAIGPTWAFNAGFVSPSGADIPNHIVLDTTTGTATWAASHKGAIPMHYQTIRFR